MADQRRHASLAMALTVFRFAVGLLAGLVLLLSPPGAVARAVDGDYHLEIRFDLERARLTGHAAISLARPATVEIDAEGLHVIEARVDGAAASPTLVDGVWRVPVRKTLIIRYEADPSTNDDLEITSHNIRLGGNWYPAAKGSHRYRLRAVLPQGWRAISEADEIRTTSVAGGTRHEFVFPHPLPHRDGITFVASDRLLVARSRYRHVDLYAYFLPDEARHATRFLAKAAEYLARFERQLGSYPYRRFSMVEQTGVGAYSLPTYVVLPPGNIRPGAWADSALDHEIAHQWLGNLVFNNDGGGNWNEGLALYMADYLSAEIDGRGWECRRRILTAYGNRVGPENNFPLVEFAGKGRAAAKFIGYGKSGMVFHMLRREVGDRNFFRAVRKFVDTNRFRAVSWDDIRRAFEAATGRQLTWFFRQWTQESALPEIDIGPARVRNAGRRFAVDVVLRQTPAAFRLRVPVAWRFPDGRVQRDSVVLAGETTRLRREFAQAPIELVVDEDFEVFRRLAPQEFPATIERLLTRPGVVVLSPAGAPAFYGEIGAELEKLGDRVLARSLGTPVRWPPPSAAAGRQWRHERQERQEMTEPARRAAGVVLLDRSNPLLGRLWPELASATGDFEFVVHHHPADASRYVGLIHGSSETAIASALEELPTLWKFSRVVMMNGRVVETSTSEAQRGLHSPIVPIEPLVRLLQ